MFYILKTTILSMVKNVIAKLNTINTSQFENIPRAVIIKHAPCNDSDYKRFNRSAYKKSHRYTKIL